MGIDVLMTRQMTYLSIVVFLLISGISAVGCSSSPSDARAKADLQHWFNSRWPGTVQVVEYQAVKNTGSGRKIVLEYRARGQFMKDTYGCVQTCCGDVCFDKLVDGMRWISKASDNPHVIRKGDLFETRGRNTYTKTVAGWSRESR